ncbi:MAG: lysophospholipid acyltransferase family protein [Candidatus Nanopelagicales bacterium]
MARGEKTLGWRILAAIVIPGMNLLGRYEFRGLAHVPAGAAVISPNHYSNIDPLVMAYAVWRAGRVPRFLGKASLFRVPVLGAILRATGQIPVERRSSQAASGDSVAPPAAPLAAARRLTDEGLAVIVYPEGTLTRDPGLWPMRGKSGAVRLALEHGVPLVPVASWGAQRILPRYGRISLFPRKDVVVAFGEPVDLSPWQGRPLDREALDAATTALMDAITALLAELRAETPPERRWDPAEHGQSEFGTL